MDNIQHIVQSISAIYQASALFKVVLGLIILFLILFIYLFIDLSIKRNKNRKHDNLKEELENYFSGLIINYLISSQSPEEFAEKSFSKPLLTHERVVFTEILVNLAKNLEGETKDKIKLIFKFLQLQREIKIQLDSEDNHKVVNAISTLSALALGHEYIEQLKTLSRHDNMEIRKVSNKLLIQLLDFKHLRILSKASKEITVFEQLMIINEFSKKSNIEIPALNDLFLSKSDSFIVLLLKLCKAYQLKQYELQTIKLLETGGPEVKIQALSNIGNFGYNTEKEPIKIFLNSDHIHLRNAAWEFLNSSEDKEPNLEDHYYYNKLYINKNTPESELSYSSKRTRLLDITVNFLVILSVPVIVLTSEFIYHYYRGEIKSLKDFRLDLLHDVGLDELEEDINN